jgi:gamma-glutamylaminecyclotransferase
MGKMKELFMEQQQYGDDTDIDMDYRYEQHLKANKDLIIAYEKCNLVFVYGTLRKGFGNHSLLEHQTLKGKALTKYKYVMYASGIPFVKSDEAVTPIVGEIYELDGVEALKRLDRLESHPDFYKREVILCTMEDGTEAHAWLYFAQRTYGDEEIVETGDYADYRRAY